MYLAPFPVPAGDDGVPETVYVNVLAVTPVIVNVPLYSLWLAPLIVTCSPSLYPWAVSVAVAVVLRRVMEVSLAAPRADKLSAITPPLFLLLGHFVR